MATLSEIEYLNGGPAPEMITNKIFKASQLLTTIKFAKFNYLILVNMELILTVKLP